MHRSAITAKLGVHSVAKLTTLALEAGVLGVGAALPEEAVLRVQQTP